MKITMFLLSVFLTSVLSGCLRFDSGRYSYKPEGPAFELSDESGSDIEKWRIGWTSEWRKWSEDNGVDLLGFYVLSAPCIEDYYPLAQTQFAELKKLGDGKIVLPSHVNQGDLDCWKADGVLEIYPKYKPKGYDPEEWAQSVKIRIPM